LPKSEPESIYRIASELGGRPLIALIETVRGVMELRDLTAASGLERLAFGSVDFSVDSGISDVGDALTSVRSRIVLESCYAGLLPPADGVSLEFRDPEVMKLEARRAQQLGFGGKLCIHPRQVASVNAAFLPTEKDVAWATRVIAAVEESGGGATRVDGEMVDKPVLEMAQRILAG
jgi:citrate lyase subunit beta/citryl-CoA lyase